MSLSTYARRKGDRLCVVCESPELATRTLCEPCRKKQCKAMAPRTRRMRAFWRAQKRCLYCGREPMPNTKYCGACAERGAGQKKKGT